jgi:predicted GIY-YIG superfamily endonuclease
MGYVYILQGTSGRFYIGASEDPKSRLESHNAGRVYATKRLGLPLKPIAKQAFPTMAAAVAAERKYKQWKNPQKVIKTMLSA